MGKIKPTLEQKKIFHYIDKRKENILIEARAGAGKCLGENTPVLMYDGSIKMVQNIVSGDQLMGDDGNPRNVLSTNVGFGDLYKIIPQKGDSWVCNDIHVMTLHHEEKKELVDVPLNEITYSKYPNGNYRRLRLQRSGCIEYVKQKFNIDPYLLGLWLGDGKKENGAPVIFVHESETPIIDYLKNVKYKNISIKINDYRNNGLLNIDLTTPNFSGKKIKNVLREEFKKCLDGDNIFIPKNYLINSKEVRLKLLAGLLDSDGHRGNKYYEITTKHETLKNDILYLCRSLGFAAYAKVTTKTIKKLNFKDQYWRITISGSFEDVPCLLERKKCKPRKQIKCVLRTGFKKEYIGKGDYYGFTLDGNGRFLLGDFTITHNTSTIVAAVNLLPKDASITFLAFNKHIQEELKRKLPPHVWCYTSHGLGLSAIKRKYGDDIEFDEFKVDHHINKKRKRWNLHNEFENSFEQEVYLASLKKLINLCRATMTTDKKYVPYIAEKYDIRYSEPKDVKRVMSVLEAMTNDRKHFDYTDMIYLPAIDPKIWMFPQDYVIVDECFPHNQYISTEIGKKKIGHLAKMYEKGEQLPMVETFNEQTHSFEKKNIVKVWCNGERDIYEVVVGGKRKIKSTKNHKYLTLDGWKRLDDLVVGDAILSNYSNQPYHGVLTRNQKRIFIGSILGDGSLHNLSKNISRIRVIHGEEQKEYVDWKASFFNSNVELIENNGFADKIAYRFTSKGYYFNDKHLNIYNVIDEISPKSLAIAWMDDGNISTKYNTSRLYSCADNKEYSEYLSKKIKEYFKIESQVKSGKSSSSGNEYYWLLFDKENTEKLSNLISEFIHPSMSYKLCPKHRININSDAWLDEENQYGCMVVTEYAKFVKRDRVYDMEVEDNHNFIITSSSYSKDIKAKDYGLIAHNCQDLNRAQQAIIQKILKRDRKTGEQLGRLISVGDPFQSIYSFAGSDIKSFEWFQKQPNTKVLHLTHSFRCGENIIKKAQDIVPDIKAKENAHEGLVREGSILEEAKDGDFVLCRTTMPLVKLFFAFLMEGKKAIIKGSDIGISLVEMTKNHKSVVETINFWNGEIKDFEGILKSKGILNFEDHSGYVALKDKVGVLDFFGKISKNLEDMRKKIRQVFRDDIEGIVLSTVHKAKGLEADRVFIARPDKLPLGASTKWQADQELNLEYVAITRAKNELIYDWEWTDEEEEDVDEQKKKLKKRRK